MQLPAIRLLAAVLLGSSLAAQDSLLLTDGTRHSNCRVLKFTVREVEFRVGGSPQTVASDRVARIETEQAKDVYKRGYAAIGTADGPGTFLTEARKQLGKNDQLAQYGFFEAARLFWEGNQPEDAFTVLGELVEKYPETGFAPYLYRWKLEYYLSLGKEGAANAQAVAKQYVTRANAGGYAEGFLAEANYYETMARAVAGEVDTEQMQRFLEGQLATLEPHPLLAARIRNQLAYSRMQQEKWQEAHDLYDQTLRGTVVDPEVRANSLLGRGQALLELAGGDSDRYREAMLDFLRVYVDLRKEISPELVGEALFHAALACERWGGQDAGLMRARLRGRLRRDYADTSWAKKG